MSGEEDEQEPFTPNEQLLATVKVLRKKKADDNTIIDNLLILLNDGKGQSGVKDYTGEQLANELVKFSTNKNKDVAITAAKVLRSITVHKNNKKRFKKYSATLLNILKNSTPKARVPLTAVIWNLSSIASNREELIKADALPLLISLLEEDGEIQGEAAGALRNFTLDEDLFETLAATKLIPNMVAILDNIDPSDANKMMWNILDSFENLSVYGSNHAQLATKKCISSLMSILEQTQAPTFQKFVLTIFYNLSTTEEIKQKLIKRGVSQLLLQTIQQAQEENLITACQEVLLHIHSEESSELQKKIRKAKLKNPMLQSYAIKVEEQLQKAAGCDPIKENDIHYLAELGEGSFGAVYLAEYRGFPVAVKFLKCDLSEKGVNKVFEELKIMRKLKHPNVVLLMGATIDAHNQIIILTEYATRGDLKTCLNELDSIAKRLRISRELARGLSWLHYHHVTHRDLKLENIFITENWAVKIGDFGLSIQDNEGNGWYNFRGNVKYSAPELLRERALRDQGQRVFPYGLKTDVYSFGLIWYEILMRISPFKDKPDEYKGREGQARFTLEGHRPTPPNEWPKQLCTLMQQCWDEDPQVRPTFEDILSKWDNVAIKFLCPHDKVARTLIKSLWNDQTRLVSFEDFKKAFVQHCLNDHKLKRSESKTLANLFRENLLTPCVSFEHFCHVVGWYGPLDQDTNCEDFFARAVLLKSQQFFRDFETEAESDASLKLNWKELYEKEEEEEAEAEAEDDGERSTEKPSKSVYLMKHSLTDIGKFELRWIDESKEIKSVLISNMNGSLVVGDHKLLQDWTKLSSAFNKYYNLQTFAQY